MATVDSYLALAVGSWAWVNLGNVSFKPTGQPIILTYSFETRPAPDVGVMGNVGQAYLDSFQPLTDRQRAAAKTALDAWSAASGIIFVEAKSGFGDIRFGVYDFNLGGPHDASKAAGYAGYPGDGLGGDVFIGKTSYESVHIFLHEIGHALGLKHPFDGDPTLAPELDNYGHTVMSYTSGGHSGNVLGDLDLAAIAYLYGAAGTAYPGTWSWDAASQTLTQTNTSLAAVIRGVGSGNVITAGDDAKVSSGGADNAITARDRAMVYIGRSEADGAARVSVLTLGDDAKVSAIAYGGSLRITAGDRADIMPPGPAAKIADTTTFLNFKLGAGAKVNGVHFGGRVEIVAGDNADISMPTTPANAVNAKVFGTVSVGANSKVNAYSFQNTLAVTAGDGAQINLPFTEGAFNAGVSATVSAGANATVSAYGYKNAFTITAGDGAKISLPSLAAVKPDFSIKASVTAGNGSYVWGDDFLYGLTVKTGDKANVNVGLGAVTVTVGAESNVFVNARTALTPEAGQISHFHFGLGGSFSGVGALATNVVTSAGGTNVFGGKGSEIVFNKGGNFYVDGGAGTDIVIVDGAAPAAFHRGVAQGNTMVWFETGVVDGKTQARTFVSVEYVEFDTSLYSVARQKYLTDFPALQTAYRTLLRTSGPETSHLLLADLALKIDTGGATRAGAVDEIVKLADATTSVASMSYQFFTGKIPSAIGIDFLISPTGGNSGNLNSDLYAKFNTVNRYINFAMNLGKFGEAKDSFAAAYGELTLFEATRKAYGVIFGAVPNDAKVSQLLQGRIDFLASFSGDPTTGIGTKAAMVGFLLAAAATENVGVIARSNDAWLTDLADGSAPFGVDILDTARGYYKADFIFGGT